MENLRQEAQAQMLAVLRGASYGYLLALHLLRWCATGHNLTDNGDRKLSPEEHPMSAQPSDSPSRDVCFRLCGYVLLGWLLVPNVPHATLPMEHLDVRYPDAFKPLLHCMMTEDIVPMAMKAFERVAHALPRGDTPCA
jgi:hypothetical protein